MFSRRTCPRRKEILRQAHASNQGPTRGVRQNLGLVVGLQGRFAEAEQIVRADLPAEVGRRRTSPYLKQMLDRKDDPRKGARVRMPVASLNRPE